MGHFSIIMLAQRGQGGTLFSHQVGHFSVDKHKSQASNRNIRTGLTNEYLVWLKFMDNGENVLAFLQGAITKVERLVDDVLGSL
jgi:hypothetical protein